jgi:hypothetical protein
MLGKLKPAADFSNFSGFFSFVVSSGDKNVPPPAPGTPPNLPELLLLSCNSVQVPLEFT